MAVNSLAFGRSLATTGTGSLRLSLAKVGGLSCLRPRPCLLQLQQRATDTTGEGRLHATRGRAVGQSAISLVGGSGAAVDGVPKTPAGCWAATGKEAR